MLNIKHKITCWGKACFVLTGLLLFINIGFAQKIPTRPVPPRLVNDYANILSDKEESALEHKLVAYNDSTSTQICVVTVTSLDGTTSDDFAQKLGEKWGVGTKNNNGVVILVKPKTADELGDVSIQVGYGMEPYITDAVNYGIRTKEMIPAFKEGNYYKGIDNAVNAIIGLASGAYKSDKYASDDDSDAGVIAFVIFIVFLYFVLRAFNKNDNNGSNSRRGGNGSFWRGLLWGILLSGGNRGGSGWGSSGGSWGGGYSSGGFGGFGGGHFGGGGGSSKW